MSDVSYNSIISAEKQYVNELHGTMYDLEKEIAKLNNFIYCNKRNMGLMVAKLKRERLIALAALSRSKLMLAEMELYVAESDLNDELNKNPKKVKLSSCEGEVKETTQLTKQPVYLCSISALSNASSTTSTSSTLSSSPTVDLTPYTKTDSPQNRSTSKISLQGNVQEIQTPPVTLLSTLKPTNCNSSSNTNKSLTDSIIAEFENPHLNSKMSPNVSNSTTKLSISTPKTEVQVESKVKIRSVNNITGYQKAYQDMLSYKSHVLYTPPSMPKTSKMHPNDPRNKVYALEAEKSSPISLAVPQMINNCSFNNKNVDNSFNIALQDKKNTIKSSSTPENQHIHKGDYGPHITSHRHVPNPHIFVPIPPLYYNKMPLVSRQTYF